MGSILGILTLVGSSSCRPWRFSMERGRCAGGMDRYPRMTRTIVVVLPTLPILAACTSGRLFPGCYEAHVGGAAIPIGDCHPH